LACIARGVGGRRACCPGDPEYPDDPGACCPGGGFAVARGLTKPG
jgi:hypothetical protein